MELRRIADLGPGERTALFERDAGVEAVREDVREVIDRVREEGDVAVREFTREFDEVEPGNLNVTDRAARAYDELDEALRTAIETAADTVRAFHERQVPDDWRVEDDGRELGRRFRPVESAGVSAPGGTAAYPSRALMGVVPATVAGVEHVAVATPPAEEMDPATLAAIHAAGADAVYAVGCAQAIAALAYGTETLPRVRKVVGPGNRWVTAAKAEVRGDVDVDFLAGPSEILVVADGTADPEYVAADLVAQAEHDEAASVVAVTDDEAVAEAVVESVDRQASERRREETIRTALAGDASGVLLARSMSEAISFADEYAAEHLSIQADDEESVLARIDHFGSAFLGPDTPVAAGDYASGTNHVLPTGGRAKVVGGLSVDEFLRGQTVQRLSHEGLADLSGTIETLAAAEGLDAHAESVRRRFDD
jgi:histidinol dehydrogenase